MKIRGVVGALFCASALPLHAAEQPAALRWKIVHATISRKFRDVPTIKTAELARWLTRARESRPLLLDVRTREEFEISHLAGARRVEPNSDPRTLELPATKETPIVTYCSVGYRSAEFARALRMAGFKNVRNLTGSIFQWANEDRPLVREGGVAARSVHPYNAIWGGLLKKERRANLRRARR